MTLMKKMADMPTIFKGIFLGFFTLFVFRVTWPLVDAVINLWTNTDSVMYYVSILVVWLVYYFFAWVYVWAIIFKPKNQEVKTS